MRRTRLLPWIASLPLALTSAGSTQAQAAEQPGKGVFRGASIALRFDVSPPLRSIPAQPIQPGEDRDEFEERPTGLEGPLGPQDKDALVQSMIGPGEIPTPLLSFDGPNNLSGVSPPDPVGDVGPNHYVAMSNLSFQIFNKSGVSVFGPAANNTLWAGFGGPCQTENAGDPVVLYDQLADRWILTQFTANGPTYFNCVAVSTTPDPTGSYFRYAFTTGTNFPDYPKYGIWPDALYISTREFSSAGPFAGVGAYAVNRAQLIAGNPAAQVISFLVPPGAAPFNVGDGLLPADMDGMTLPPAGSPEYYMGSMDNGGPYAAPQDALTLWKFHVDFAVPANSTFTLTNTIPVAAFDSIFPCSPTSRDCIPQPGTTAKLDILSYRQRPLHRLAYRNFGSHESLVTNQSVEAAPNMAGIRWYELRDPNGAPNIFQQGTYAPGTVDGIHRWMGSIAMDTVGNMALGYSASSTAQFPSSWYTGRLAGDPAGTMPQGEGIFINGTGSQTGSPRWGDYTSMNVDPVDDCTFWYVNEWVPTTSAVGWRLRIGAFKFPSCSLGPTFTLAVTPPSQAICAPADGVYTVNVGSVAGFSNPVTLSATGNPAGTTVGFSTNPVTPPGSSTLTIGNTGAATAGSYVINVQGQSPDPITQNQNVTLDLFTAPPGAPTLLTPADGAINQPVSPTFTWSAASQAPTYTLEIATDAGFGTIVHTASGLTTTTYNGATLNSNTTYFWRVRGVNACAPGGNSPTFTFSTQALPGDCPTGTVAAVLYTQDFEGGAAGWTHSGTGDSWAVTAVNPHGGAASFHADDPAVVTDQRLVSPPIALPAGQTPLTLKFWNYQSMEPNGVNCYDGGILEVSTNGGGTWTQVTAGLLTDPYNGVISNCCSNPLVGLNAWCGDPQPYLNSVVSLDPYAGQTVQFRFRLGSDSSVSRTGWNIDDVVVQACPPVPVELQSMSVQ